MKTRRIPQFVVVAGLLGLATMSLASEGNWIKKVDMPTARFGLSASVVDGRIYVIGGTIGQHHDFRIVEEYDPAKGSWTKKADMSNVRCWHSASVVNGKIYVIGGFAAEVL